MTITAAEELYSYFLYADSHEQIWKDGNERNELCHYDYAARDLASLLDLVKTRNSTHHEGVIDFVLEMQNTHYHCDNYTSRAQVHFQLGS
jgi:hypothetical protein